ncbi:MAG: hypothetical protein ACQCN4_10395 [Candidatus Bathyarchaeia archaeon]
MMLVAILTLSSLMLSKPATSQITKPSVPEFTIQLTEHNSNTTYSPDPYTGKNITHVGTEWTTLDVKIKNQPFTPYSENGETIQLYYNIRIKGHYVENWVELYQASDGFAIQDDNSDYTVLSYAASSKGAYIDGLNVYGQVDFQVKAMIGYIQWSKTYSGFENYTFIGENSGWSNTQTFNFGDGSTTTNPETMPSSSPTSTALPSQNPTATPDLSGSQSVTQLGVDWIQVTMIALLVIIAVLFVSVVVFLHKRSINAKPRKQ